MEKQPKLSKKATIQLLFKSDTPHSEMGNLSAISVVKALDQRFFDSEFCTDFVLRAIHRNEAVCPHCKAELSVENFERFWKYRQFYCSRCRKKSHATTHTILSGTTLSPEQLVCMGILFVMGFTTSPGGGDRGNITSHRQKVEAFVGSRGLSSCV